MTLISSEVSTIRKISKQEQSYKLRERQRYIQNNFQIMQIAEHSGYRKA